MGSAGDNFSKAGASFSADAGGPRSPKRGHWPSHLKKWEKRFMNLEDEQKLKFDRRLRNRRGWVKDEDVQAYEQALPDVSEKAAAEEDEQSPAPEESH